MCDTFIIPANYSQGGFPILAKNSDREFNEPQYVEHIPAIEDGAPNVDCTYLAVPSAGRRAALWLSRPVWMFGAEMGINEHSVAIGNEAVFTRMPYSKNGLLGMDLLRLALERANDAETALEVIIDLLQEFGQGGAAGFRDKRLNYHNTFIIADPNSAWVLETAGPVWVAQKVSGPRAISNGLSIEEEFDLISPDAKTIARKKGWWKKGEPFNFARCYSDPLYTYFARAKKRSCRTIELIEATSGREDISRAAAILRDHGPEYDYERKPSSLFGGLGQLCMHAREPLINSSQTTGSMIAELRPEMPRIFFTGTSGPCLSIFKPAAFGDKRIDTGVVPEETYAPGSIWWESELLHRKLLRDYSQRRFFAEEAQRYEDGLIKQSSELFAAGDNSGFSKLSFKAWGEAIKKISGWRAAVEEKLAVDRRSIYLKLFHRIADKSAGVRI